MESFLPAILTHMLAAQADKKSQPMEIFLLPESLARLAEAAWNTSQSLYIAQSLHALLAHLCDGERSGEPPF